VNNNPCPDQFFGTLSLINGVYKWHKFSQNNGVSSITQAEYINYKRKLGISCAIWKGKKINRKKIVIVLESPHISEFDLQGNPLGPAHGTTGRLFDNNFAKLINKSLVMRSLKNKTYDVIIMNAVQYQCSLGKPLKISKNKLNRDKNWILCFFGKGNDLIQRIKAIKPDVVINLCTKGFMNLQLILNCFLLDNLPYNIYYTYGSHPSTWNFSYSYII